MTGSAEQGYQADSENGLWPIGQTFRRCSLYLAFCLIGAPTQDLLKST